jgi:hypothetical protein
MHKINIERLFIMPRHERFNRLQFRAAARVVIGISTSALLISVILLNLLWTLRIRAVDNFNYSMYSHPGSSEYESSTDFQSFVASGLAAKSGLNPYASNNPLVFRVKVPYTDLEVDAPNLNPPISVFIFEMVKWGNINTSFWAWRIISFLLYTLGILIMAFSFSQHVSTKRILWLFSLAGLWQTLEMGQIYIILVFILVICWCFLRSNRLLGVGILIGLMVAIRPNFGVWPVILLFSGYWKISLLAFVTTGIIGILPAFRYGSKIYFQWLEASSQFKGLTIPGNSSLIGLGAHFDLVLLAALLSTFLVVFLIFWTRKSYLPLRDISALAVVGSLLASPITWSGYSLLLLPIILERRWNLALKTSSFLLSTPVFIIFGAADYSRINRIIFGWWYGWALLLVLAALLRETTFSHEPSRLIHKAKQISLLATQNISEASWKSEG